jgi:hypothetical protein
VCSFISTRSRCSTMSSGATRPTLCHSGR